MKYFTLIALSLMSSLSTAKMTEVTMCLPASRSELMEMIAVIARDRGMFEKHGLKVTVNELRRVKGDGWKVRNGSIERPRVLDYKVADHVAYMDMGCQIGASTAERFIGSTVNMDLVKPLILSSFGDEYDTHLMVSKKSKLKTVEELRGKTLRVGQLPTYVATIAMLEAHHITRDQVTILKGSSGSDKLAAIENGLAEASTAYLPAMAYLMAMDRVRVLEANIISKYVGRRVPHSLLIANAKFAEENPETIKSFNVAMKEAHAYLLRNPGEIFHAFSRSRKHPLAWGLDESKAKIEKAAAFIGKVPFVDLTVASAERDVAYCDVKAYGQLLEQRKLFAKSNDLARWLNVPAGKNCGSLNLAGN